MERINAKDVKSMMEAYASVYKTEEAESEVQQLNEQGTGRSALNRQTMRDSQERRRVEADRRVQAAGGGAAAEKAELERLRKANVKPKGTGQQRWRPKTDEELTRQARYNVRQQGLQNLKNNPDFQAPEKVSASTSAQTKPTSSVPAGSFNISPQGSNRRNEVEAQIKRDNAARTDDQRVQPKPAKPPTAKPAAANPNVTKDGTKFERRLPTMAELRAAQAARRAAPKVLSRAEIENRAVKAGVGEGQRKPPTAPPPVSSTKPAAKPAVTAAGNKAAELAALRAKAKADTLKRTRSSATPVMRGRVREETELDVFDVIKGHFIEEGLTEEEALAKMLDLTDEERTEIIESMASANRMKELEKERLSNRAPSVKYPAKPAPYGGARSREFEKRLPTPQSQKARSREFEHGSTRSSDTPSGNLGDGLPRDKKGNIMR